jgi:predicted dehydrogenase
VVIPSGAFRRIASLAAVPPIWYNQRVSITVHKELNMADGSRFSRRKFLKNSAAAAAALAAPAIVPATVLGKEGRRAPSDRIPMAFIGIGNMGGGHLGGFSGNKDVQILAVCDARQEVRERSKKRVDDAYNQDPAKGCKMYEDFRVMLLRPDIDAVLIATPEHWHAIMVIEAARAGKDIYCEKPLSHTIVEARAMVNAVRRNARVLQTGSQQRSDSNFRLACELVRSGRIGKLHSVHVAVGGTSHEADLPEQPVPYGLDWNMWQGPIEEKPYNAIRASGDYGGGWRLIRDYSGGMMCDWGAHHFDIAQWGLGMDESGPVEIFPPDGKDHPVLTYRYANGVPCYHMDGPGAGKVKLPPGKEGVNGILFVGENGWVEVNRGYFRTWPEEVGTTPLGPDDVHLYESPGHAQDWINCMRARKRPICDVEVGCRTITTCHLGNLAYWLERPIRWDPAKEQILGDEEATRMMDIPKRAPWHL